MAYEPLCRDARCMPLCKDNLSLLLYMSVSTCHTSTYRSLVSLLRLWGEPLSREQIKAIFEASRPLFYGECSNALASSYPAIRAVTLVTSSHGSYQDRSQDPSQEQLGVAAYETANMATEKCTPLSERQEMYRIAAEAGHAESRVR